MKRALKEIATGFNSLLTGMRITLGQAFKPVITVQYPRQTLKMPDRFRGHIQLVLDPITVESIEECAPILRALDKRERDIRGALDEAERALIELTLRHTGNNRTRTAEILGISTKTLFNKLREYGASE